MTNLRENEVKMALAGVDLVDERGNPVDVKDFSNTIPSDKTREVVEKINQLLAEKAEKTLTPDEFQKAMEKNLSLTPRIRVDEILT